MSHATPMIPSEFSRFALAGRSVFTVVAGDDCTIATPGERFTIKFARPKPKGGSTAPSPCRFAYVETGGSGRARWSYLGWFLETSPDLRPGKSRVPRSDPAAAIAEACAIAAVEGSLPGTNVVSIYHNGACGACGRKLTDPVSIATGLGPECTKRIGADEIREAARETVVAGKTTARSSTTAAAEYDKIRRETYRTIMEAGEENQAVRLSELNAEAVSDLESSGVIYVRDGWAMSPEIYRFIYGPDGHAGDRPISAPAPVAQDQPAPSPAPAPIPQPAPARRSLADFRRSVAVDPAKVAETEIQVVPSAPTPAEIAANAPSGLACLQAIEIAESEGLDALRREFDRAVSAAGISRATIAEWAKGVAGKGPIQRGVTMTAWALTFEARS
jgi:hypothetical protein